MRTALSLIGLLSIWLFPWWVPFTIMIVLSVRYRAWEVLIIGMFLDFTWLPGGTFLHPLPLFMIAAFALVWVFEPLRTRFSF